LSEPGQIPLLHLGQHRPSPALATAERFARAESHVAARQAVGRQFAVESRQRFGQ
jgi:hypothetical protein